MSMKKFDRVASLYDFFMHFWHLYKDKVILELIKPEGKEVIVDLGGGTGHYSLLLSSLTKKVVIVDESPKMLEKMPEVKNIEKICGDILNLPFENNIFDVALLCDVFHHVNDQKKLLAEIFRILKKGGRLIIYDFESKSPITKLLKIFEEFLFGKLYFKTLKEIEKMLEDLGFKIVEKRVFSFYFIILCEK